MMARYIDAEKIKVRPSEMVEQNGDYIIPVNTVIKSINDTPTEDVAPVVRAEWNIISIKDPVRYECSNCNILSFYMFNYCPYCGAIMSDKFQHERFIEKRNHGHWSEPKLRAAVLDNYYSTCSVCKKEVKLQYFRESTYCPYCGAKMDEGEIDDT